MLTGEWLHRCSWPPLQQASAAYMHSDYEQTDRRTDITTGLHIASFTFTRCGRKKRFLHNENTYQLLLPVPWTSELLRAFHDVSPTTHYNIFNAMST